MHIVLVDHQVFVRQSLKYCIERLAPDLQISDTGRIRDVRELAAVRPIDLIVVESEMRGQGCGHRGMTALHAEYPDIPMLLMCGNPTRKKVTEALEQGLAGVISKRTPIEALIGILRLVLAGEKYFPATAFQASDHDQEDDDIFVDLTPRQHDVLGLLMEAHTNKEIAVKLGLKEVTVKLHLQSVYRKFGVHKRLEAVKFAMENGFAA